MCIATHERQHETKDHTHLSRPQAALDTAAHKTLGFTDIYVRPDCVPIEALYYSDSPPAPCDDARIFSKVTSVGFADIYSRPSCEPIEALYYMDTLTSAAAASPACIGYADIYSSPACVPIETLYGMLVLDEEVVGIGAYFCPLQLNSHLMVVKSLLPGSPAKRCGKILAGDAIVSINGTDTRGKRLPELAIHMLGAPGTPLDLVFFHSPSCFENTPHSTVDSEGSYFNVRLKRVPPNVGYANIYSLPACVPTETLYDLTRCLQDTSLACQLPFPTTIAISSSAAVCPSSSSSSSPPLPTGDAEKRGIGSRGSTPSKFAPIKSRLQESSDNVVEQALSFLAVF